VHGTCSSISIHSLMDSCKSEVTFCLTGCSSSEFQCESGECISLSGRCNRRVECRDGSDEDNCREYHISNLIQTQVYL
jgi:hypothetical protein